MTYTLDELSVIELMNADTNSDNNWIRKNSCGKRTDGSQAKRESDLENERRTENLTQVESFVLDQQADATKVVLKVFYPPASPSMDISLIDNLYTEDVKTNYVNLLTIHYGTKKSTSALSGNFRTWTMTVTDNDYAGMLQNVQQMQNTEQHQTINEESEHTNRIRLVFLF